MQLISQHLLPTALLLCLLPAIMTSVPSVAGSSSPFHLQRFKPKSCQLMSSPLNQVRVSKHVPG